MQTRFVTVPPRFARKESRISSEDSRSGRRRQTRGGWRLGNRLRPSRYRGGDAARDPAVTILGERLARAAIGDGNRRMELDNHLDRTQPDHAP